MPKNQKGMGGKGGKNDMMPKGMDVKVKGGKGGKKGGKKGY